MNRSRLYLIMFIACIAGYAWLGWNLSHSSALTGSVEGCFIKNTTNMPCPSCGSTRGVMALTQGNFAEALSTNPFSYIIAVTLLMLPLWLAFDILLKRSTLYLFYKKSETYLKRPWFAIPLILVVLMNWIWNITKGI